VTESSRRKGLTGEREAADLFEDAGWTLRGYESGGDWLAVPGPLNEVGFDGMHFRAANKPHPLHVEVKRAERLKLPEWIRQAEAEAVPGSVPCVVFRASREPWRIVMRLEDYLR